jgi:hypothetical protein
MIHSEIKFNQTDATHRVEAMKCLRGVVDCHKAVTGIHDQLAGLHDDLADVLYEFRKHLRRAVSHMHQIGSGSRSRRRTMARPTTTSPPRAMKFGPTIPIPLHRLGPLARPPQRAGSGRPSFRRL